MKIPKTTLCKVMDGKMLEKLAVLLDPKATASVRNLHHHQGMHTGLRTLPITELKAQ